MIIQVLKGNIYELIEQHESTRGGVSNEDTYSDSMFFFMSKHEYGCALLHEVGGPIWIGIQNATARFSADGKGGRFKNIEHALTTAMSRHPITVYYSDDAVTRLQFIAFHIQKWQDSGDFLLIADTRTDGR